MLCRVILLKGTNLKLNNMKLSETTKEVLCAIAGIGMAFLLSFLCLQ